MSGRFIEKNRYTSRPVGWSTGEDLGFGFGCTNFHDTSYLYGLCLQEEAAGVRCTDRMAPNVLMLVIKCQGRRSPTNHPAGSSCFKLLESSGKQNIDLLTK